MKELSLNVLDIAKNSVKARATLISISIEETEDTLRLTVADDGCGMTEEILESVTNPFCTTRTTRKVGMGIPLLKLAAEQTGGEIAIVSRHESVYPNTHGTEITALFYRNHIDFTPMGDITSTLTTLIQGSPEIEWVFLHRTEKGDVTLDTRQLREILGADIPLNSSEILTWIGEYLGEQYQSIQNQL